MDILAVLGLVQKGLGVVSTLITVGENAAPAIKSLVNLVKGAQDGTLTADDLDRTEATLDSLIEDFNKPIE